MSGNSVINLGDLSKPATVLIEKIAEGIGGAVKPFQIVRIAKAKAKVSIIEAEAEMEAAYLRTRTKNRFWVEEERKQVNIEQITREALPNLNEDARPEDVENDWIANFFNKCRLISDPEMQRLWSQVLSGEANSPGAFSKRTVNFLSSLDKKDAVLFTSLCRYVWTIQGDADPLILDFNSKVYCDFGIDPNILMHLDSIGLINLNKIGWFVIKIKEKQIRCRYFDQSVLLNFENSPNEEFRTGKVVLTQIGKELETICGALPNQDFFDFVCSRWKEYIKTC